MLSYLFVFQELLHCHGRNVSGWILHENTEIVFQQYEYHLWILSYLELAVVMLQFLTNTYLQSLWSN